MSETASLNPVPMNRGRSSRERGRSTAWRLALLGLFLTSGLFGQVITEFPLPTTGSDPEGIVVGPDGNLWFTENVGNNIGRITPAGVITEFPIPTANSQSFSIALGSDGNLWFTEVAANKIGRITPAGVITEFPITTGSGTQPYDITAGPDGSLWFTQFSGNRIGRITIAGVDTAFTVPTFASNPRDISTGPDGNLWFAEKNANKIGRVTTTGTFVEFPVPTAASQPIGIARGPDGNIWFTEFEGNKIGRITPTGTITEFPVPTPASHPIDITTGPDGNLWFTEGTGNNVGRITRDGVITEFPAPTPNAELDGIVTGPDGAMWFIEETANQIGRITVAPLTPEDLSVDSEAAAGTVSNVNGVLEAAETVLVAPSWRNTLTGAQTFTGAASDMTGPPGPTYTLADATADYGTVDPGAIGNCQGGTGDCYLMSVSGARPAAHWDALFTETLSGGEGTKVWKLHIGESFPDVPVSDNFYAFIENLFHNGITGGCAGGGYCPTASVTRAQMAVFLMKSKLGSSSVPPAATGTVFGDVPASNPFAPWIEQLASFQITGGCGGGNYCPNASVTRAQMAAFLLKSEHGSAYVPPACTGTFPDVSCPSLFAAWIEQLAVEGVTGGCGGGNYCPNSPNTRGQMAVFLVKTFGLELYGP